MCISLLSTHNKHTLQQAAKEDLGHPYELPEVSNLHKVFYCLSNVLPHLILCTLDFNSVYI